jgi:hypothetical protein
MQRSITDPDVIALLEAQPNREVAGLARDRDVVKALAGIFNATLELVNVNPARPSEAFLGLAARGAKMADAGAAAAGSRNLKLGAFVGTQMVNSLGLIKLAGHTPARAAVFMSFAVAEKGMAMAGLMDQRTFSRCQMAIGSLSVTTGLTVAASWGTAGIALLPGILAVSAELVNTYVECRHPLAL